MKKNIILSVKNLKTEFVLDEGTAKAVDGVSFDVERGQVVGIVGESVVEKVLRSSLFWELCRSLEKLLKARSSFDLHLKAKW